MKILITCQHFNYLSGAPMYVYELGRQLVKNGHEVTIVSNVSGDLKNMAETSGIKCVDFMDLEEIKAIKPDVIHCNQKQPSEFILSLFPDTPAVATIHSEYEYERPYIHENIKKYICIRPSIEERWKKEYPDKDMTVIYNGIDMERYTKEYVKEALKHRKEIFKQNNIRPRKIVCFVGTVDHLRKAAAIDLMEKSLGTETNEPFDLWFIGRKFEKYLDDLEPNVRYIPETWFVDKYVAMCDETAGILLGRTTIEGWAMGKPGWIYDVDLQGNVKSVELHEPPKDMSKFDIKNVSNQIEKIYAELSNKHS